MIVAHTNFKAFLTIDVNRESNVFFVIQFAEQPERHADMAK